MDARFTEAVKSIVGDKYDDFPQTTLELLFQLWEKARQQELDGAWAPNHPVARNLSFGELRDVRDVFLTYLKDAIGPTWPTKANGKALEPSDPQMEAYFTEVEEHKRRWENIEYMAKVTIPVVAPVVPHTILDAVGWMESKKQEVLLWMMNPREFVDIQKLHLEYHTAEVIHLCPDHDGWDATLWGTPVLKSTEVPAGSAYLIGCQSDPPDNPEGTPMDFYRVLKGQYMTLVRLDVAR
jgi:hypothetical protein